MRMLPICTESTTCCVLTVSKHRLNIIQTHGKEKNTVSFCFKPHAFQCKIPRLQHRPIFRDFSRIKAWKFSVLFWSLRLLLYPVCCSHSWAVINWQDRKAPASVDAYIYNRQMHYAADTIVQTLHILHQMYPYVIAHLCIAFIWLTPAQLAIHTKLICTPLMTYLCVRKCLKKIQLNENF